MKCRKVRAFHASSIAWLDESIDIVKAPRWSAHLVVTRRTAEQLVTRVSRIVAAFGLTLGQVPQEEQRAESR